MLVDAQNDGLVLMVDIEPWGQTTLCEVQPDRLVSERQNHFTLAQVYLLYSILGQSVSNLSVHDQEQEKSFKI